MTSGLQLLNYNVAEGVRAFSTTRYGGVGTGAYSAFNITHYCGDSADAVAANRRLLCEHIGVCDSSLLLPRQTHGAECRCVDDAFMALGAKERAAMLDGVDAVITALPGVCIGVSTADCVPLLMYDAVRGVVAAVHAGWRGTVAGIAKRAVAVMSQVYGTVPQDVKVVIGPSISVDAFEVGDEVYEAFVVAGFDMERVARRYGSKWHLDLWEANRLSLLDCGVADSSIDICGVCTYAGCDRFFSARRLGIASGRIFSGIMIKTPLLLL